VTVTKLYRIKGTDLFVGDPKTAIMPEVGAWLKKVKEIQK
jgi:hypothetical protein